MSNSVWRFTFRVLTRSPPVTRSLELFTNKSSIHTIPHSLVFCSRLKSRRIPNRRMSRSEAQRMVWVDLEMTGLDIDKDQIIEMACIVTDSELNVIAEGPNLIIHQPDELLDGMSDWCKQHHGKCGAVISVSSRRSMSSCLSSESTHRLEFALLQVNLTANGNSVHADKKFLDKYMPQFMHHLHYRIIDVSTIKELSRRWYPDEYNLAPSKKSSHRALDDIQESIKELAFYRVNVFKAKEKSSERKWR
ncbi:hypothetical protein DNTS_003323 [Danionella cerebrum]|uniref:Oligoribonuclease, mitochondrial n=1 Tax=Danionella cerebrum TaxID=2873325 RepID=A0A553RFP1_9TELE|nr:hypothetical protein DNTS_003323 [Danionella translucida]